MIRRLSATADSVAACGDLVEDRPHDPWAGVRALPALPGDVGDRGVRIVLAQVGHRLYRSVYTVRPLSLIRTSMVPLMPRNLPDPWVIRPLNVFAPPGVSK